MARKKPPVPSRVDMFYDDPRRFPLSRSPRDPSDRPSRFPSNIPPYLTRRWLHWLQSLADDTDAVGTEDVIAAPYNVAGDQYEERLSMLEIMVYGMEVEDPAGSTVVVDDMNQILACQVFARR